MRRFAGSCCVVFNEALHAWRPLELGLAPRPLRLLAPLAPPDFLAGQGSFTLQQVLHGVANHRQGCRLNEFTPS